MGSPLVNAFFGNCSLRCTVAISLNNFLTGTISPREKFVKYENLVQVNAAR